MKFLIPFLFIAANAFGGITAPGGSGTVTSVAMSVPALLSVAGSPVTGSGTLALTYSGTALPLANGGTSATTKAGAFDALSPMTTAGDIIIGGASGTGTRLAAGTSTFVLTSNGAGVAPSWQAAGGGGGGSSAYGIASMSTFTTNNGVWNNITAATCGTTSGVTCSTSGGGLYTIATTGVYAINARVSTPNGATNEARAQIAYSTAVGAGSPCCVVLTQYLHPGSVYQGFNGNAMIALSAGDELRFWVLTDDYTSGSSTSWFSSNTGLALQ